MKVLIGIGLFFLTGQLRVADAQCGGLPVGTLVPNESDCQLYYTCDGNGNAVPNKCIDGYYFDPVRKYCRPSSEVSCGCGPGTAPPTADPTKPPTADPTEPPTAAPTGPPTEPPTEPPTVAPPGPPTAAPTASPPSGNPGQECNNGSVENGALLPYPNDCGRFIQCSNGVAVVQKCPSNLHFNIALGMCDWPSNAGCSEVPPISTECSGVTNGDLLPYPGDCGRFIQCSNGVPVALSCPRGLHFNESEKICDWPSLANCSL